MENPKSHSKTKLKWKMCIGIALLAVISCCCLAVYGYFKFFPALALMFFPSHILTASTRTPTDPRMTPGVPTEVRTMLPADLLEQKTRYTYLAVQTMRDCNQSVDELSVLIDSPQSRQKPLDDEWANNLGDAVDQFSIVCSDLEKIVDPAPKGFLIFAGYSNKASKVIPQIVEKFRLFISTHNQVNFDEAVKHLSKFRENIDAANKELISLIQPAPGD